MILRFVPKKCCLKHLQCVVIKTYKCISDLETTLIKVPRFGSTFESLYIEVRNVFGAGCVISKY